MIFATSLNIICLILIYYQSSSSILIDLLSYYNSIPFFERSNLHLLHGPQSSSNMTHSDILTYLSLLLNLLLSYITHIFIFILHSNQNSRKIFITQIFTIDSIKILSIIQSLLKFIEVMIFYVSNHL